MTDLVAYRAKARAWLESMNPKYGRDARRGMTVEEELALGREFQALKYEAGYAGINWPTAIGGQGLGHLEKITYDSEEMQFGMPTVFFGISLGMPVPILMRFGLGANNEHAAWVKERVVKALRGEEIWCQLFSEPAGGSDLAGLRTRAEPDGNGFDPETAPAGNGLRNMRSRATALHGTMTVSRGAAMGMRGTVIEVRFPREGVAA